MIKSWFCLSLFCLCLDARAGFWRANAEIDLNRVTKPKAINRIVSNLSREIIEGDKRDWCKYQSKILSSSHDENLLRMTLAFDYSGIGDTCGDGSQGSLKLKELLEKTVGLELGEIYNAAE